MSVNYRAGIAYGWEFSGEEYKKFNEITKYKYEDDFIILDPYSEDSCQQKAIFGIWIKCNSEIGTASPYLKFDEIDKEFNVYEWIKKFGKADYSISQLTAPKYFLVNQIY